MKTMVTAAKKRDFCMMTYAVTVMYVRGTGGGVGVTVFRVRGGSLGRGV